MKKTILGILLFIAMITSSVFSQTALYKVSGKVTNEKTGEGIAQASVSFQLSGEVTIMIYREPAVTGPDGTYSIDLPQGTYYLIVKHPDFKAYLQKEIKVTSDLQMDFKLTPASLPVEIKNYVKGVVVNKATDSPVAGAVVNLLAVDGRKFYVGTTSDKSGNFTLANIPSGDFTVSAFMAGYIPYHDLTKISIGADTKIENLRIALEKDNSYTTTVVKGIKFLIYKLDASGVKAWIPNAKILLVGSAPNVSYKGVTDNSGVFELAEAAAGSYKLLVSTGTHTEYTSADIKTDGQTFEVEMKEPVPVGKATIKGRVFFNADSNPVAGASVYVVSAAPRPEDLGGKKAPYFGCSTGPDGEYTLNVLPGEYYIACTYSNKIDNFGGVTEFYNDAVTIDKAEKITVANGAVITGINFGLDKPAAPVLAEVTISGSLVDNSAKPVLNAKLSVYEHATWKQVGAAVKTGADGKYIAVVSLTKGVHELVIGVFSGIHQPQFYNGKTSMYEADIVRLDITGDKAELKNIDFVLKANEQTGKYSISGLVTDNEQKPLTGAVIEAYGGTGKAVIAQTDSTGSYRIAGLAGGKYIVGFTAKGYVPQYYKGSLTWENAAPVELYSDISGIDAMLKKVQKTASDGAITGNGKTGGKIGGTVAGKDKKPLGGARVVLSGTDGTVVAADVSDSEGQFSFEAIPDGNYRLIASKVNYQSMESVVNISAGKTAETITLSLNSTTGLLTAGGTVVSNYILENNYPNPFNPSTRIRFSLPEAANVKIEVYSLVGQKVATLIEGNMNAGVHEVTFNASGLSSGIYFYKMSTESFTAFKTMHLLK